MNRKNLTAAVLAGVAGIAGVASTAQAVNLNPDGLGEVLIYPYYTSNDGNQTLLTVVNTTGDAKAVKVRFLEGYNSREVLDFNLYMSEYDVWVGAIADGGDLGYPSQAGVPHLLVPDTSCTVPYLYGMGVEAGLDFGLQAFLPYEYTGDNADGGPTDISRAAEGYFEIIEMGVMTDNDAVGKNEIDAAAPHAARMGSKEAATHILVEDEDTGEMMSMPADCELLVENWTTYLGNVTKPHPLSGWWASNADSDGQVEDVCFDQDPVDDVAQPPICLNSTIRNGGGLFGSAAVVNVGKGTMFSYDAKAIQGFDTSSDGIHFEPGTINPSIDDGNQNTAYRGQRDPITNQVTVVPLTYGRGVDAVSAVFMHDTLSNQFTIQETINAGTEWVMTFPTKSWYVDPLRVDGFVFYTPDADDEGCNGWDPGEPNPYVPPQYTGGSGEDENDGGWLPGDPLPTYGDLDWTLCTPLKNSELNDPSAPFTELFDGEACEVVSLRTWDREESPTIEGGVIIPPIVSPAPPGSAPPGEAPFELCYEVNVLRFGEVSVFGTDSDLLLSVTDTPDAGWGRVTFGGLDGEDTCVACDSDDNELHQDALGLRGLPVTGFAAEQYTNGELAGGVLANYGGLFQHKGSSLRDECSLGSDVCVTINPQ